MSTPVEVAIAEERRTARLVMRLTPTDAAELEAHAAAAGIDRASYARALVRAGLAAQSEVAA